MTNCPGSGVVDAPSASVSVGSIVRAGYKEAKRSKLLPKLDVEELTTFVQMPDQAAAAKAYWKRLAKTAE